MKNFACAAILLLSFSAHADADMHPPIPTNQEGAIVRTADDKCKVFAIGEAEGFHFRCTRSYSCSDGNKYAFKYDTSPGEDSESTSIVASCKQMNAEPGESCQKEPSSPALSKCWNEAIDKGILRHQSKMATSPSFSCVEKDAPTRGFFVQMYKTATGYDYQFGQDGQLSTEDGGTFVTTAFNSNACTIGVKSAKTGRVRFTVTYSDDNLTSTLETAQNLGQQPPAMSCTITPALYRKLCPQAPTAPAPASTTPPPFVTPGTVISR